MTHSNNTYLAGGLDKGIPFDSGKETMKKVGVKIGFAKSKFDVGKFEWEVVSSATLGVTCEKIMSDQTDHRRYSSRNPVHFRAGP